MQTTLLFAATVTDAKWNDELWSGRVEASDVEVAKNEAVAEYHAYIKNAYEPGDYKAAGAIVSDVNVSVSRVV